MEFWQTIKKSLRAFSQQAVLLLNYSRYDEMRIVENQTHELIKKETQEKNRETRKGIYRIEEVTHN